MLLKTKVEKVLEIAREIKGPTHGNHPDFSLEAVAIIAAQLARPADFYRGSPGRRPVPAIAQPGTLYKFLASASGRSMTAAEIHQEAFGCKGGPLDWRAIGDILRAGGKVPRKSNGRLLFDI